MKLIVSFLFVLTQTIFAGVYEINRDHSHLKFSVEYLKSSTVEGQFRYFQGKFQFDTTSQVLSQLNVKITAKTIDTLNQKRDFHLRGHEFLFAAKYPEIIFTLDKPLTLNKDHWTNTEAQLSLRDKVKKNLPVSVLYKGSVIDPWGKENLFFELKSSINRKEFDMTWNKILDQGGLALGEDVSIHAVIQAQVDGASTSFSTHMVPSTKGIVERDLLKKGSIKKLSTSTDPADYKAK